MKGFPSIDKRADLYRLDGRLNKWLQIIAQHGPASGRAIEVGCAPGVLLEELAKLGYDCVGVEISQDVASWLRLETGLDIRAGFFPGLDLPTCDLFLSFDVLEHSPSPLGFMCEIYRLLVPGGVAILQTTIDRYDFDPPFGPRFDLFDDVEHSFLFTDRAIANLAERSKLEIVSLTEQLWIGGEIVVLRKP